MTKATRSRWSFGDERRLMKLASFAFSTIF